MDGNFSIHTIFIRHGGSRRKMSLFTTIDIFACTTPQSTPNSAYVRVLCFRIWFYNIKLYGEVSGKGRFGSCSECCDGFLSMTMGILSILQVEPGTEFAYKIQKVWMKKEKFTKINGWPDCRSKIHDVGPCPALSSCPWVYFKQWWTQPWRDLDHLMNCSYVSRGSKPPRICVASSDRH